MPPRYDYPRDNGRVSARWRLGLVVVGLVILYWLYPTFALPGHTAPSSSPTFVQQPGMRASWYDAAAPDVELSANPVKQDPDFPFKYDEERIKDQGWRRSPLRWTRHRGPPNRHSSPIAGPVGSLEPVTLTPRGDHNMKASTEPFTAVLTPAEQTKGTNQQSEELRIRQCQCRPYNPSIVPCGSGKPIQSPLSGPPEKRRGKSKAIPTPEPLPPKQPAKQVHSEIIPRLGCTCQPYVSSILPCECEKSESVGIEKRLVESAPESDHHVGDVKGLLAHSQSTSNQNQQSQAEPLALRYLSRPKQSVSREKKYYVPPGWRHWRLDEPTRDSRSFDNHIARSKTVSQVEPTNSKQNYTKPNLTPAVTDVLIYKKCNATTALDKNQCESTHQATIIFYSLLGVFGISIFMLGLLKCVMCFRSRQRAPAAMEMRTRLESKSGNYSRPSFAIDSLASRREKPTFEAQRYATLDGANDDWRRESGIWWNVFSRGRRTPGRFSPVPQARAPRIPTLKLPKPVFTTVRKVSGLGFDGMLASYRQVKRGKESDISRLKWMSTV